MHLKWRKHVLGGNKCSKMSRKAISPSLVDDLRSLLGRPETSDVVIRVVPKDSSETERTFPAHRCILKCRTTIPVSESTTVIVDGSPEVFKAVLEFIYTDVAAITEESVQAMLHFARRYHIPGLEIECFNYLINRLSVGNVFMVLEEAKASEREDVKEQCLKAIEQNPHVFESKSLSVLSRASFSELISMDSLPLDESVVFQSAVVWSAAECEKQQIVVCPENQRKVLGETLFKVRFLWLPEDFIFTTVVRRGLLNAEEISELWEVKSTGKFRTKLFEVPKRNSKPFESDGFRRMCRFIEVCNYDVSGCWPCEGDSYDAIALSVSRPVFLVGISLYGPRERAVGFYNVGLELHDGTICVSKTKTEIIMKKSIIMNNIWFPEAILLRKDHRYDICLRLKGPATYYGALQNTERFAKSAKDGCPAFDQPDIPKFVQDGVEFTIGNSHLGTSGRSDSIRGLIPEILFRLVDPAKEDEVQHVIQDDGDGVCEGRRHVPVRMRRATAPGRIPRH